MSGVNLSNDSPVQGQLIHVGNQERGDNESAPAGFYFLRVQAPRTGAVARKTPLSKPSRTLEPHEEVCIMLTEELLHRALELAEANKEDWISPSRLRDMMD